MATKSLQKLYIEQLQDLYDAEQQIIKALPKMISAAQSEELRSGLSEHLEITKTQAERIDKICEELDQNPENERCKGMEGVLRDGSELVKKVSNEEVRDAAIIAAAQRVEHYEMAGYGTARTYATLLGYDDAAGELQKTLDEEKEADETLSGLAEKLNVEALEEGESRQQDKGKGPQPKSGVRSKRAA